MAIGDVGHRSLLSPGQSREGENEEENIFGSIVSANMLCMPRESKTKVTNLRESRAP